MGQCPSRFKGVGVGNFSCYCTESRGCHKTGGVVGEYGFNIIIPALLQFPDNADGFVRGDSTGNSNNNSLVGVKMEIQLVLP